MGFRQHKLTAVFDALTGRAQQPAKRAFTHHEGEALARLVKDKVLKRDHAVPVIVRNEDDAEAAEVAGTTRGTSKRRARR